MPKVLRQLFQSLPLVVILVILCYFYADRSLALWANHLPFTQLHQLEKFDFADDLTELFYAALILAMPLYVYLRLSHHQGRLTDCLGLVIITMALAFFIKTPLQYIIGRDIPRYYNSDVLLFVRNAHLYGFRLFHGGSFPSGHMSVFTAGFYALCFYYRRLWPLAVVLLLILACLLLLLNYHFLSDVIAGTYLGLVIGTVTACLYAEPVSK